MANPPPKQPSAEAFAGSIMSLAARIALAIAESNAEEDIVLFALYIHVRNAEEHVRKTYLANRSPGSPSFFDMRKNMQKIADELRRSAQTIAKEAIPGLDDMTEEQLAQALAMLQIDPDDLPKA